MSTDPASHRAAAEDHGRDGPIRLDGRYRLGPNVSLRPERFGALAYSFDTRRLSFLKHPDLVRVVEALDDSPSLRDALVSVGVDEARWPGFMTALDTLERSEMIRAA